MRTKLASRRRAATEHDPDGVQAEKTTADGVALGKYRAEVKRLRDRWDRDGFNPQAHLEVMTMEGDRNVLAYMANDEARRGMTKFGAYLAHRDIWDALRRHPLQFAQVQ